MTAYLNNVDRIQRATNQAEHHISQAEKRANEIVTDLRNEVAAVATPVPGWVHDMVNHELHTSIQAFAAAARRACELGRGGLPNTGGV